MHISSGDAVFSKITLALEQTLYIEANSIAPATRLVDDLALGRFGRIRLAMYLEEIFEIEIPDDTMECFDTVGDITLYLRRWSLDNVDLSSRSWLTA